MINESIHQEAITIINIYVSNIRTLKYIKKILTDLKEKIHKMMIVRDFNTPLSKMVKSPRQISVRKHWTQTIL